MSTKISRLWKVIEGPFYMLLIAGAIILLLLFVLFLNYYGVALSDLFS